MQNQDTIRNIQRKLISLGYPLPRFGADGDLGDETRQAIAEFARRRNAAGEPLERVLQMIEIETTPFLDETTTHPGAQWRTRKTRSWAQITGITLHQTAVLLGEEPSRWHGMNAHFGVTRAGRALYVCPVDRIVWHGNGFNSTDIGIELDGYFEGVEGLRNTLWSPPNERTRRPLTPTQEQIETTRRLIRWLCDTTKANGGNLQFIHAHRQSSSLRQSDPGSFVWREVGVWAQRELGLSDGGRGFKIGTGLAIPEAWDRSRPGIAY
jgi:N-acetyl-anhydromuramyl-L-alanine amidase AmpD